MGVKAAPCDAQGWYDEVPATLAQVNRPANCILAGDGNKNWYGQWADTPTDWVRPMLDLSSAAKEDDKAWNGIVAWLQNDYTDGPVNFPWECPQGAWMCKGPSYRHTRSGLGRGQAVMMFVDSHVKPFAFGTLKPDMFFPTRELPPATP